MTGAEQFQITMEGGHPKRRCAMGWPLAQQRDSVYEDNAYAKSHTQD